MSHPEIAKTLEPPYYAVIFTSQRADEDGGYDEMSRRMVELASKQPGFLGIESVRGADGFGITVSYWKDEESVRNWKENTDHRVARSFGRRVWYENFMIRVARVERAYGK